MEMTSLTFPECSITLESSSRKPGQSFGQSAWAIFGTMLAARSRITGSGDRRRCNMPCRICAFWSCGRKSRC